MSADLGGAAGDEEEEWLYGGTDLPRPPFPAHLPRPPPAPVLCPAAAAGELVCGGVDRPRRASPGRPGTECYPSSRASRRPFKRVSPSRHPRSVPSSWPALRPCRPGPVRGPLPAAAAAPCPLPPRRRCCAGQGVLGLGSGRPAWRCHPTRAPGAAEPLPCAPLTGRPALKY